MKIYHFASSLTGGANIAGLRLHKALFRIGIDSTFFHGSSQSADRSLQSYNSADGFLSSVLSRLHYGVLSRSWSQHGYVTSNSFFKKTLSPIADYSRSIICLHWIAGWLDLPSFFMSIPRDTPIFWVLHDLIPVTGGCSNPYVCTNYKSLCGRCPQLKSPGNRDISRRNYLEKLRLFRARSINLVANSSWTLNIAQQSSLGRAASSLDMISYGLDTQEYQPIDQYHAKSSLRLATSSKILIGFASLDLNDERKGARILLKAIALLDSSLRDQCMLVGMGGGLWPNISDLIETKLFGSINHPHLQSIFYSSLDFFVLPSLSETFGNVVIEAMACQTPVVAFDCGGPSDIITSGYDGILVNPLDEQALSRSIAQMIEMPSEARHAMGSRARSKVNSSFTDHRMAELYLERFTRVLSI